MKFKTIYILIIAVVIILALVIRFHNLDLSIFNTSQADDGGGHIKYVEVLLNEHRLPTSSETYLAWHEPLYYYILVGWIKIGSIFGLSGLDFWQAFNILVFLFFICVVWMITYVISKNHWLALLNVFLFSFLFVSVKLTAYVNNEFLNQALILLLILLFVLWDLLTEKKYKRIICWSLLLGLATLVKLTAFVILFSAIIIWLLFAIKKHSKVFLIYILLAVVIIGAMQIPWLVHKQRVFGQAFSVNLYETKPRQNIITSDAWGYFFKIDLSIFESYPYWNKYSSSFFSILLSDTFGDYYNLFNNRPRINNLSSDQKILIGNGRYTTPALWYTMINTNRFGLIILLIWVVGFIGYWVNNISNKKFDKYELFLLISCFGGFVALLYNNLRLPYLERGVLKMHFVYFILPIFTIFSYKWWFQLKDNFVFIIICVLPLILYLIIAWPMLYIS